VTDLQQVIDAILAFLDAYRTNAPEGWWNTEFLGTADSNALLELDGRVYVEARKAGLADELPPASPGGGSLGRTHVPVGGPMPEDDSAWVRAATIWTKDRDRFPNGKAFRRYLDSHPEVRKRRRGQRLEVHAGDEVSQQEADATLEILRKKRRQ
jgi:hypothetical protein